MPFRRRSPATSASATPATQQPAATVTTVPGVTAAEIDGVSGELSAPPSPMTSVASRSSIAPDPATPPPPPRALLSPVPPAAETSGPSTLGDGEMTAGSAEAGAGTMSPAVAANGSAGGREAFSPDGPMSSISPIRRSASTTPRSGRKIYEDGSDKGADGAAAGVPVRVTEQNGPRGENALQDVLVWNESGMAKSMGCRCVRPGAWCVGWGDGGRCCRLSLVLSVFISASMVLPLSVDVSAVGVVGTSSPVRGVFFSFEMFVLVFGRFCSVRFGSIPVLCVNPFFTAKKN